MSLDRDKLSQDIFGTLSETLREAAQFSLDQAVEDARANGVEMKPAKVTVEQVSPTARAIADGVAAGVIKHLAENATIRSLNVRNSSGDVIGSTDATTGGIE